MLFPVLMYCIGYLYFRFGIDALGKINFQLFLTTGITLVLSFFLYDPSDHLPFGSDVEYPLLAGLTFGTIGGMVVVMIRATYDDDGTFSGAFRAMRHYLVLVSIVALAGYAAFLPYAFAMYQVFTKGNYIFAMLALFSIIAYLALAHNQARSSTVL